MPPLRRLNNAERAQELEKLIRSKAKKTDAGEVAAVVTEVQPVKVVSVELAPATNILPEVKNGSLFRCIGDWPEVRDSRQTAEFDVPVTKQFHKGSFPEGELLEYPGDNGVKRISDEEAKEREILENVNYDDIRRAAEAHRQTRRYVQSIIRPGISTLDLCQKLEAKSAELVDKSGLKAGWAFPTGCSIDRCAAHYTPNYGEEPVIITEKNVVKVDYGIHVGGRLVDCAWTVAFDEQYDNLIQATKDATNTALKAAGIDMVLGELGGIIEEVIRSYEVEIDGKTYAVKPIQNLSGHTVDVYQVHAGKSVPIVACHAPERMVEGEVYAIETFASTGSGKVYEENACSHYALDYDWAHGAKKGGIKSASTRPVLTAIEKHFGTLAFCRRWLDDVGCKRHLLSLNSLTQAGVVIAYPPLCDIKGSFTAQTEHTVILRPTCKEVVCRGDDY